ncbi:MAG: CHAT domain-containing protein [Cyanobacteria bacterium SBLK]|nr:CHAT domain-containing protein [Cyanobacteria bacterium SBLK]
MKFSKLIESFYNLFKNRRTRQILAGLMLGLFLALGSAPVLSQVPPNDSRDARQLVQEAERLDREGQWQDAIKNLEQAAELFAGQDDRLAVTLANIGRIQLRVGRYQEALNTWNKARNHYDRNRFPNFNRRISVYEARALQALGHDLEACDRLDSELNFSPRFADELNANELQVSLNLRVCQNETFPSDEERIYPPIKKILESEKSQINADLTQATGWQNFGEVLQVLGKLELSEAILEQLKTLLENLDPNDSSIDVKAMRATTLLSLGNTVRARGNLERDRQSSPKYDYMPWRCEAIDNNAALPEEAKNFYNGGHDKKTNQPITGAKEFYQDAIDLAESSSSKIAIRAKLNLLTLILETAQSDELVKAREFLAELKGDRSLDSSTLALSDLLPSQSKVYMEIKLAKSQNCLSQLDGERREWLNIEQQLQTALSDTENLNNDNKKKNNNDTLSFVFGNMGSFDEYRAFWLEKHPTTSQFVKQETQLGLCQNVVSCRQQAQELTHKALSFAQPTVKPHIAYQWQWQLGRLSAAEGDKESAIAFYEAATQTLESVRSDLLSINSDVQFNFRDNVEPVYRGLVDLLLQLPIGKTILDRETFGKSVYYIESLQLAELENFLQCDPQELGIKPSDRENTANVRDTQFENLLDRIDNLLQTDPTSVIVYPVLLNNQIAVILKTKNQSPILYKNPIIENQQETPEFIIEELIKKFNKPHTRRKIEEFSNKVYNWIIHPFEQELLIDESIEESQIKTLVFVSDGILRNIPMAVLYDKQREQYLLQRYAVAVASGVQLLKDKENTENINTLMSGLDRERDRLPPLPFTLDELTNIRSVLDSSSIANIQLFNEEFTETNLEKYIQSVPFSVIHIATHGKFSSDPKETFIQLWNKRINANDFNQLIKVRDSKISDILDLLVLSACETATGDKRAALGLAGLAIRAGAQSTLATLWQVNDESTAELMSQFYRQLIDNPETTKAEALRRSQLELWNTKNKRWYVPFHWAPYILVGNWL